MAKKKIPRSIPLKEFNKQLAQKYREKAQHLMKCADIIEGKKQTEDKYDLLKEFVEHFKHILNKEIWECEDEIDCEIHCGSLAPEELEVWKAQRQVDIKRLKWAVENIDFELKLFLEEA